MRDVGLARTTTKEIARAVGCSEPALYRHFTSKEELFVAVPQERLPPFGPLMLQFTDDPGDRSTLDCLVEIATQLMLFYEASIAISASLFAEPALLRRHRQAMHELGTGPHLPVQYLAEFLRTEQKRARLDPTADADAAAAALLGACFQRAFLHNFAGDAVVDAEAHEWELRQFAAGVVRTLLTGIAGQRQHH